MMKRVVGSWIYEFPQLYPCILCVTTPQIFGSPDCSRVLSGAVCTKSWLLLLHERESESSEYYEWQAGRREACENLF